MHAPPDPASPPIDNAWARELADQIIEEARKLPHDTAQSLIVCRLMLVAARGELTAIRKRWKLPDA